MLKVNVGLSRKLTHDYNSTGFAINVEGELIVDLNDTEAAVEKIQEYYDVAEEALLRQIERHQSDAAIASRDEPPGKNDHQRAPSRSRPAIPPSRLPERRRNDTSSPEPASNKQVQYLLNIGKRQGLSKPQLESRIADILGRSVDLYSLSKREAGAVLDSLTATSTLSGNPG